jgi:hypothetical protein
MFYILGANNTSNESAVNRRKSFSSKTGGRDYIM